MEKITENATLEEIISKLSEMKLELNGRKITLKDILVNKNISATDKDSFLVLIQKVDTEFSLSKNDLNTGKNQIATSITNKGVSASGTETLSSLASKIDQIRVGAIFS